MRPAEPSRIQLVTAAEQGRCRRWINDKRVRTERRGALELPADKKIHSFAGLARIFAA